MWIDSLKVQGQSCFTADWVGFDRLRPINVLIGRNNSGKSQLLSMMSDLCGDKLPPHLRCYCRGRLDKDDLKKVFPSNASEGDLGGNHWHDHGQVLAGKTVVWQVSNGEVGELEFIDFNEASNRGDRSTQARRSCVSQILRGAQHRLSGKRYCRLDAERDIQPEPMENAVALRSSGDGATNIIRKYLTTTNEAYPRRVIQVDLLRSLNAIVGPDGHFTEITVRSHDDVKDERQGKWEIFLTEDQKGTIALSRSGSGLKTVLLVLLNLMVVPAFEDRSLEDYVFAFEELENSLHPAWLRRLLKFVEHHVVEKKSIAFITSHASATLDVFGVSDNAAILNVVHDGSAARTVEVLAHFDRMEVINQLGVKPSDLLQANGVVWVEGPSDRVYLNRFIELFSGGTLREGRDYQCAFYGGALLARTQFSAPGEGAAEFANLLRVNPNIVVVCDSDRTSASGDGAQLKDRVQRVCDEVGRIPGAHIWITGAKEIENYIPGDALGVVFDLPRVPGPGQFETFFPPERRREPSSSFVERHLTRTSIDKVDLAMQVAPHISTEALESRFDLGAQMKIIIATIEQWGRH